MKQPKMRSELGTGKLAVDDVEAFKPLPNLRKFLLDQTYEDSGQERRTGTIILSARAGAWVATCKEPTPCLMLKVQAASLDELWITLDDMLGAEDAPWEHDPYEAARKPKKKGR